MALFLFVAIVAVMAARFDPLYESYWRDDR